MTHIAIEEQTKLTMASNKITDAEPQSDVISIWKNVAYRRNQSGN